MKNSDNSKSAHEHASAIFDTALDSQNANAYLRRGDTYSIQGEQERASADFNRASILDPKSANEYLEKRR